MLLEEVIVTAQKRSESVQDIPVAVSAYTDQLRDTLGVLTVQDLTNITPGITYSTSLDRMFVRGIGRYTNNLATSPGIATYGDGFYNSSNHQADSTPLMTERVEVLRGPQGTLYGRNSIGGAMNVLLKRPTDTFEGEVRATVGNLGRRNLEGLFRGPITDNIGFLIGGGKYVQEEGFVQNIAGDDEEGKQNSTFAHAQLSMSFGNTDIWVKYAYSEWDDGWGNSVTITPLNTIANNACVPSAPSPTACGSLVASGSLGPSSLYNTGTGYFRATPTSPLIPFPLTPASPQYLDPNPGVTNHRQVNHDTPGHETLDPDHQVVLEVVSHFDKFDVKYVGGYHEYVYSLLTDYDNSIRKSYTYTPVIGATGAVTIPTQVDSLYVEDKKYYSNEINITSTGDSSLQWIFGLYQFHEQYQQPVAVGPVDQPRYQTPMYGTVAAPLNPGGKNYYTNADIETNSKAVFGQIDWAFAENWKASLGLRYTEDEKSGDEFTRLIYWDPGTYGAFTPVYDITPGQVGSRATALPDGFYTRHLENSWHATTGTAGLEWRPSADGLTYAKYTRGYKDGGLNPGSIVQFPYTDPEFVDAYEIGWKQTFGTFQSNLSVFYYDVKDSQIPLTVVQGPGLPNVTQTYNINAKSKGVELETIWQMADSLQMLFNYAYLDAEFDDPDGCYQDALDFVSVGPRPCVTSSGGAGQLIDGNSVPISPENKFALSLVYTMQFAPGSLTFAPTYYWRDKTYSSVFTRDEWEADAFGQLDARLTWTDAQDRYSVIGYVRNALDDEGFDGVGASANSSGLSQSYSMTPPRQYGLELQIRFGQ